MELNKPYPSSAKNKKYSVRVKVSGGTRLIHFGDKRYEHYRDKIGHYRALNHNDLRRRRLWHARHKPSSNPATASYWAAKILW